MRLIDADALMAKANYTDTDVCADYGDGFCQHGYSTPLLRLMISKMPTIEAEPVVRCKDCIHWYAREGVCLKIYSDGAVSSYAWQDRNPDDFCSYGERKDGEG